MPLEVGVAHWHWQSYRGNKQALQLCIALATETLERRFDTAFGVERNESDREAFLAQRLQHTESALAALGDAYAEPDVFRMEVEQLRQQVIDLGGQPWQLPSEDTLNDSPKAPVGPVGHPPKPIHNTAWMINTGGVS